MGTWPRTCWRCVSDHNRWLIGWWCDDDWIEQTNDHGLPPLYPTTTPFPNQAVGHNVTHKLAPDTLPLALRRSPPLGFVFEHSLLTAAPNAAANTDAAASAAAAATATATASKAAASKSVKELAAALRAFADVSF